MAYLAFDIGSSSVKAALIAEDGKLLGIARRPLASLQRPGGIHESDASAWVEASFAAGSEAIAQAKAAFPVQRVRALSVSGNGPTLVAVDSAGKPLGPALSWLDRRAVSEAAQLSSIAGMIIDPTFYLPKACRLWRQADEEERAKLHWFFSCPEYVAFALSGEACTYLPDSGYEPYIWNDHFIAALGLPKDRFPPFAVPGTIIGALIPKAAFRLGIEADSPIVAGFPDFLAAVVGSAAVVPGAACDRTGSSEALNICSGRPSHDRRLFSLPHAVPGLWNVSGGVSTSGAGLEWFASILGIDVHGLIAEAKTAMHGVLGAGFLPYLSGERSPLWDASRRGSFFGLSMDQGRSELCLAACEGLCYGLRLASELALADGLPFYLARASGRAAGEDFLCELKADILRVPVEVPEIADCELSGDAAAMALALGDASSLAEAALSLVRIARRFEPGEERGEYEEGFADYKAALEALERLDRERASRRKNAT
jgi:xylulokinase